MIQWIIFTLKVKSVVQVPIGMLEMLNSTAGNYIRLTYLKE